MKRVKLLSFLLIVSVLALTLSACPPPDPPKVLDANLVGEYELNAAEVGMPITAILRLNEDCTFNLATNYDYDVDKGSGDILGPDANGIYLLSFKTPEANIGKTFQFKVTPEGNLDFSGNTTNLPYGSASLPAVSSEDETILLRGKTLVNKAYFGVYAGTHSAMGGAINYNYTITLSAGNEYYFESAYSVEDENFLQTEKGTYAISGTSITIKPSGKDAITGGTINTADKSLSISIQPMVDGAMAGRSVRTLTLAPLAAYKGTFSAEKLISGMGTLVTATMEIDVYGNYTYTVTTSGGMGGDSEYIEEGTIEVSGTTMTFKPEDTEKADIAATIGKQSVAGTFRTAGMASALTFYNDNILGEFEAEVEQDEELLYTSSLILNADGTYELTILDADEEEVMTRGGTFTVNAMGNIVLAHANGNITLMVGAKLQGNITIDEVSYGFGYERAIPKPEPWALIGEYQLNLGDFGNATVVVLRLNADYTFNLSGNYNWADDKGSGTVTGPDANGVYTMTYNTPAAHADKTRTFKINAKGHLDFGENTERFLYGTMVSFPTVSATDPSITLQAKTDINKAYFGIYTGTHTVSAMGGSVTYKYAITLSAGNEYYFESYYSVMGSDLVQTERGTYAISGTDITITPNGKDAITGGTIDAENKILNISVQPMKDGTTAARSARALTFNPLALQKAYYVAQKTITGMGPPTKVIATLEIDILGNYFYTIQLGTNTPYTENGTIAVDGSNITLKCSDTDKVDMAFKKGSFNSTGTAFRTGGATTNLIFYVPDDNMLGEYEAEVLDEEEELLFNSTLLVNSDGTYVLTITDADDEVVMTREGTFSFTMFGYIELNHATEDKITVSSNKCKITIEEVEYEFIYEKIHEFEFEEIVD